MIIKFKIYLIGTYCTGQFDGWSCFPDTLAGTSAQVPCPPFIPGFDISSKR